LGRDRRFLGVEVALIFQFSIALFTGMVAATLVPTVHRTIPRPIEIAMWVVLVVVCVIGIMSITNPHARELTASAFWGVDQVITTLAGLLGAGLTGWLVDNRFTIATWLTLAFGADIMALALLGSYRKNRAWQPRVRLHEWMELPRLTPAPEPVVVPYAIDELNREWAAAMAVAGAAMLAWSVNFLIWAKDVLLPQQARRLACAAAVGRTESRAGLESLRHTASQVWFAARASYAAAREATAAGGRAGRAREAVREGAAELSPGRVVDIHVLVSALFPGWYGPMRPVQLVHAEEEDEDESQQTGRLAS
jgi:hypothetical protein